MRPQLINHSDSEEENKTQEGLVDGDIKHRRKKDKRLLDEEIKRIENEKQDEEYVRWKLKEDEFLKKQLVDQSRIRIKERREEPIDFFNRIVFIYKRELDADDHGGLDTIKRPKMIIDRLNKQETESMLEKCEVYRKIEKIEDFKRFWDHIESLGQFHLERLVKLEMKRRGNLNIQSVIGDEYNEDVEGILKGKSPKELIDLEEQAQKFLSMTDSNVDVEFWDAVLSRIQVQRAVQGLENLHEKYFEGKGMEVAKPNSKTLGLKDVAPQKDPIRSEALSPKRVTGVSFPHGSIVYSEDEYKNRLETIREKSYQKELLVLVKLAEKEMEVRNKRETILGSNQIDSEEEWNGEDEGAQFRESLKNSGEAQELKSISLDDLDNVGRKKTEWIDKFRPRKPHYFNRVKMGYEWNKVNQAHYDLETPPPKLILGYKFNIFYPNLLDKSKTPTYELFPTDNPDFCIIKFMAGPPYEDLAFKIVNREWNLADRQGFKCIFERGNLHLHFNFKMVRYRR